MDQAGGRVTGSPPCYLGGSPPCYLGGSPPCYLGGSPPCYLGGSPPWNTASTLLPSGSLTNAP